MTSHPDSAATLWRIQEAIENKNMALHPDSAAILESIQEAINELVNPLETSQWAIWKPGKDKPDGRKLLHLETLHIGLRFAFADGDISEHEALLLKNINDFFEKSDDQNSYLWSSPDNRRQCCDLLRIAYHKNRQEFESLTTPFSVQLLQAYDSACGTDHASKARAMCFRLANAVIKADGTITKREEAVLLEFKEVLYSPAPLSPAAEERAQTTAGNQAAINREEKLRPLEELLDELNSLVGLDAVKNDVMQLANFLKVQQLRQAKGMATVPVSRHLVFYGNPGTGKTTVARLLSQIYRSLNVLSKGHLVETDRAGLVAGYVGQTALKVKDVVNKALGGILFIDEAYALTGESQDYGREAIDTLIKLMEDNRDDLIVVVAGYTDKMNKFLLSNPGLKSRFNKYFSFEDYSPAQLVDIFELFCKKSGFRLSQEAREKVLAIFTALHGVRDETFGNARLARNVFERTINNQANRIISLPNINEEALSTIEAIDIPGEVDLRTIDRLP